MIDHNAIHVLLTVMNVTLSTNAYHAKKDTILKWLQVIKLMGLAMLNLSL